MSLGAVADVDRAVAAARAAFPAFSTTSKAERLDLLRSIVARLSSREGDMADAITEEMGAPVSLKGQTGTALAAFRQAIATLTDYEFETKMGDNIVRREPIGVCGLDHRLELADPAALDQALVGLRGRLHGRRQAERVHPDQYARARRGAARGRAFRLACSTSSSATARPWATPSARIPTSKWCPSPARPAPASSWPRPPLRRSSVSAQELGGKSANILLRDADLEAAARLERGARLLEHRSVLPLADPHPGPRGRR